MRIRIIVLKHNTLCQESRSFAMKCISEAVNSAAVLRSVDTLTLWQNVYDDLIFCIPDHSSHHLSCGHLDFELFGDGRGWIFSSHGVALCLWGIQMDPSFITSNQIVKEIIVCLKVSTRPYTKVNNWVAHFDVNFFEWVSICCCRAG